MAVSATHLKPFPAFSLVQNRQINNRREQDPGGRVQTAGKLSDKKSGGVAPNEEVGLCDEAHVV